MKTLLAFVALAALAIAGCTSVTGNREATKPAQAQAFDMEKVKKILDALVADLGHFPSLSDYFASEKGWEYMLSDDPEIAKILLWGVENDYWEKPASQKSIYATPDDVKGAAVAILQRMRDPSCFEFFKEYYTKEEDGPPKRWRYFWYHATPEMAAWLIETVRNHVNEHCADEALYALHKNDHLAYSDEVQDLICFWLEKREYDPERNRDRDRQINKYIAFRVTTDTFTKLLERAIEEREGKYPVIKHIRFVSPPEFNMRWNTFEPIVREYIKKHPDVDLKEAFDSAFWGYWLGERISVFEQVFLEFLELALCD